jgi:CRP-like cAMP-binding protein
MDLLANARDQNRLLANLPHDAQVRLRGALEGIPLDKGSSLWDAGETIRYVYFPTAGLVSLMALTAEGGTVELATVAREGIVGLPILLQAREASHQAVVRLQGAALRLSAATLRVEMQRHEGLRSALLAYAHRVSGEMAQAVICQCYHNVLQRLCRWLVTASDSTGTDTLELTHESLAAALGVLRSAVTEAAIELQDADAIRCRHGRIVIRNRLLLRRSACECYEAMHAARAGDEF